MIFDGSLPRSGQRASRFEMERTQLASPLGTRASGANVWACHGERRMRVSRFSTEILADLEGAFYELAMRNPHLCRGDVRHGTEDEIASSAFDYGLRYTAPRCLALAEELIYFQK